MPENAQKIGFLAAGILVSTALLVDGIQLLFDFFLIGELVNWAIDLSFAPALFIFLYIGGYLNQKNVPILVLALVLELIPIVQIFSFWTPFIVYIIQQSRKGDIGAGLNVTGRAMKVGGMNDKNGRISNRINRGFDRLKEMSAQREAAQKQAQIIGAEISESSTQAIHSTSAPTRNLLNLQKGSYNENNVLDLKK